MFDQELYRKYLSTNYIGKNIQYYDALQSTNTKAFELAKCNVENGTVIITDYQTLGRGRQSNKWFSVPGKSLTFSIILYPNCPISEINKYSIISGLAVHDALSGYNITPQLKWPNDILINYKKIGGILCESKLSGEKINTLVVGIGININETEVNFPDELKSKSTSLLIESNQQNKIEIVLANLLNIFEQRLTRIVDFKIQISDWERNCAHLNDQVSFKYDNKIINGIFKGLTQYGEAIILVDGKDNLFSSGELEMP